MPNRASLSVCCVVGDPPERVAAALAPLREVADEVVVAVDAASPAAESPALAAIADRFYRVEFELPFERYLAWVHSVCSGDWIFRIDGDEVPGASLVDRLPELVVSRRVHQFRVPRRWVFGDATQWLADAPWQPDYQIRLVRNDPATLRFAGLQHTSADPVLPAGFLVEPLYHLKLLVKSADERERDARAYERLEGGRQADNDAFYLPERRDGGLALAETPAPDRELVERVLAADKGERGSVGAIDVPLSEVDRHWAQRDFDPGGYDVDLEFPIEELRVAPAGEREVAVLVRNRGTETLPRGGGPPNVRASYHWLKADGEVEAEGDRTLLPADVPPGEEAVVPLRVVAPTAPGSYVLEADLVHEGMRWFGRGARLPVAVTAPPAATAAPRRATEGRLVCVTGMHRSGTSLVTRLLVELGLYVGEETDLLPPGPDNLDGFWERRDIVALDDEVLRAVGGSAVRPPLLLDSGWESSPAFDALRDRARSLLGSWAAERKLVGWKDPRTSLTLPFWRNVTDIDATILTIRHPLEVARSLERRNGMSEHEAVRLYVVYVVSALRNDPECLVVRYDDLFEDLDSETERLASVLGVARPALGALSAVVKPSLRAARLEDREGEGEVAVAVSVYRLLSEGRREVILALAEPLIEWALEQSNEDRLAVVQRELADARAREQEIVSRRSVRIAFAAAGALARLRP